MDLAFKNLKNKLVAQVDNSSLNIRRSTSPRQDNHNISSLSTPEQPERFRRVSETSSVTSDTPSLTNAIDGVLNFSSRHLRRDNSLHSSHQSISDTSFDQPAVIDVAMNDNDACSSVYDSAVSETGSTCNSRTHISTISESPSSSNKNEEEQMLVAMPTAEEIEAQKMQILANYTTDQIVNAFVKNKVRLQNYKISLRKNKQRREDVEKEHYKLTQLLESTQDKYMRKIGEMKEASQLDRDAKAHLEGVLNAEIEEKTMIIESLNQKVALLKAGRKTSSEENLAKNNEDAQLTTIEDLDNLRVYETFCSNLRESFHLTYEEISAPAFIDLGPNETVTSAPLSNLTVHHTLAARYVEIMKGLVEQSIDKNKSFDKDQIQCSLEHEAKLNELSSKLENVSAILNSEKSSYEEMLTSCRKENEDLNFRLLSLENENKRLNVEIEDFRKTQLEKSQSEQTEGNRSYPESLMSSIKALNDQKEELSIELNQLGDKCRSLLETNSDLDAKLKEHDNVLNTQKVDLDNLHKEKQDLVDQNEKLNESKRELEKEIGKVDENLVALESEKCDLVKKLEIMQSENEKLSIYLDELQKEMVVVKAELSSKNEALLNTKNELQSLQSSINYTQSHAENDRKNYLTKIDSLNSQISDLESYKTDIEAQIKSKCTEIDQLNQKLKAEVDDFCEKEKNYVEKINLLTVELESLKSGDVSVKQMSSATSMGEESVVHEDDIVASECENVETVAASQETMSLVCEDDNVEEKKDQVKIVRTESTEESTQTPREDLSDCNLLSCSNEKCDLQANLTSANARIEELLVRIESLSTLKYDKDKLNARIEELRLEKETLEDSIASISKDRDNRVEYLSQQIKELSVQFEFKSNELETASISNVSNEDYDACMLENVEVKRNFHQLSQEFESLREKLLLEKQEALNEMEISMKDLMNKEVRSLANEKIDLLKNLDSLKSELCEKNEKIENMETEKHSLEEKVQNLTNEINKLKSEVENLRNILSDKDASLAERISLQDFSEMVDTKKGLQAKISELELTLEKERNDFNLERDSFNEKMASLEKAFVDADSNASKVSSLLEEYEKSYTEKIEQLVSDQEQQETEVQYLKSSLEDSELKYEELSKDRERIMNQLKNEKASFKSEIEQYCNELKVKQKEIEANNKTMSELQNKIRTLESTADQHKSKFDEYKKKVEEKFSSQKQIISEKFKIKDKEISQSQQLVESLEAKLKTLTEEKEALIKENADCKSESDGLAQQLSENQKILNSTLEQSQNDMELVRHQYEQQITSLKSEIESLKSKLDSGYSEKIAEYENNAENLKCELSSKENSVEILKSELAKANEKLKEMAEKWEEEKQSTTKAHYVERNKLSADVKLLQNEKNEVEMTLANVKRDFQKYQLKMEDSVKKSKEQLENLKVSSNKERLAKDRELKNQTDELNKVKEINQKIKSKHSEEVAEIKSRHTSLVKSLDEQIRETKSSLQKTIDSLTRNHEDEMNKLLKEYKEQMTQMALNHENTVKNLLLESEQKAVESETELSNKLNEQIEMLRNELSEKDWTNQKLDKEVSELKSQLRKETLTATLNEYKQKYENLMTTSQSELKRMEKQSDDKIRNMENRFNEEQRVLEKQVQEQKLIIANLEFEIQDLQSNYDAERSRNDLLAKESKRAQKSADLTSLLEAKECEIQRMEQSMKASLKAKESEYEDRLKKERDRIVREMDEFYLEKYGDLSALTWTSHEDNVQSCYGALHVNGNSTSLSSVDEKATMDESKEARSSSMIVKSKPAVLKSSHNMSSSLESGDENSLSLEDPTQLQFLRQILRQFILGSEKVVMARVLVTMAKFDEQESKELLKAVKHSQKWIPY